MPRFLQGYVRYCQRPLRARGRCAACGYESRCDRSAHGARLDRLVYARELTDLIEGLASIAVPEFTAFADRAPEYLRHAIEREVARVLTKLMATRWRLRSDTRGPACQP